jgi:hypothetical protein
VAERAHLGGVLFGNFTKLAVDALAVFDRLESNSALTRSHNFAWHNGAVWFHEQAEQNEKDDFHWHESLLLTEFLDVIHEGVVLHRKRIVARGIVGLSLHQLSL